MKINFTKNIEEVKKEEKHTKIKIIYLTKEECECEKDMKNVLDFMRSELRNVIDMLELIKKVSLNNEHQILVRLNLSMNEADYTMYKILDFYKINPENRLAELKQNILDENRKAKEYCKKINPNYQYIGW